VVGAYLRQRRSETRVKGALSLISPPNEAEPAQAALERDEEVGALRDALGGLHLKHRTVLVMYELEQWSGADIAEALAIPIETVYHVLAFARQRGIRCIVNPAPARSVGGVSDADFTLRHISRQLKIRVIDPRSVGVIIERGTKA